MAYPNDSGRQQAAKQAAWRIHNTTRTQHNEPTRQLSPPFSQSRLIINRKRSQALHRVQLQVLTTMAANDIEITLEHPTGGIIMKKLLQRRQTTNGFRHLRIKPACLGHLGERAISTHARFAFGRADLAKARQSIFSTRRQPNLLKNKYRHQ